MRFIVYFYLHDGRQILSRRSQSYQFYKSSSDAYPSFALIGEKYQGDSDTEKYGQYHAKSEFVDTSVWYVVGSPLRNRHAHIKGT